MGCTVLHIKNILNVNQKVLSVVDCSYSVVIKTMFLLFTHMLPLLYCILFTLKLRQ